MVAREPATEAPLQSPSFIPADCPGRPLSLGVAGNRGVVLHPLTAPKILWYREGTETAVGDLCQTSLRAGSDFTYLI